MLATADLVKGKTIGIDATTLEANAALRSIVRRDSGETYQEFLTRLAQASGIDTPTRADLARLDQKRPKKGRNAEWRHPHDPDARITKMKDGRTHVAHKAEHAVDMETGAIVGVTVQGADQGDTTTIAETLTTAAEELKVVAAATGGETAVIEEVVADKGTHSNQVLVDLAALDLRTYIAEPDRGRRKWTRKAAAPTGAANLAPVPPSPAFARPLAGDSAEGRERELVKNRKPKPVKNEEVVPTPTTLREFAPRFIDGHAEANRLKPSGQAAYRSTMRIHLIPTLGDTPLGTITTEDVQRLKSALHAKSPKTVNNVLTVLNVLMKTAVTWGVLERVPCAIKLLRVQKSVASFYDFDDYERLVEAARADGDTAYLIALLGARQGYAARR
jgi:hypothetical protein